MLDPVARFAGQRVAAVVADTPALAERGASLVQVEYEPLAAVFDPAAALAPGRTALLHGDKDPGACRIADPGAQPRRRRSTPRSATWRPASPPPTSSTSRPSARIASSTSTWRPHQAVALARRRRPAGRAHLQPGSVPDPRRARAAAGVAARADPRRRRARRRRLRCQAGGRSWRIWWPSPRWRCRRRVATRAEPRGAVRRDHHAPRDAIARSERAPAVTAG